MYRRIVNNVCMWAETSHDLIMRVHCRVQLAYESDNVLSAIMQTSIILSMV